MVTILVAADPGILFVVSASLADLSPPVTAAHEQRAVPYPHCKHTAHTSIIIWSNILETIEKICSEDITTASCGRTRTAKNSTHYYILYW